METGTIAVVFKKFLRVFHFNTYKWLLKYNKGFRWKIAILTTLYVCISLGSVVNAIVTKQILDRFIEGGFNFAKLFIVLLGSIYIFQLSLNACLGILNVKLSTEMSNSLQKHMIEQLYGSEWEEMGKYHSGDLLTRLTSDVDKIVSFWTMVFPSLTSFFVQLIAGFTTLFYFDKVLAILAFLLGPITGIFNWIIGKRLRKLGHLIQEAEGKCRSYINESIQNILIIKSFEYEDRSLENIAERQKEKLGWLVKRSKASVAAESTVRFGFVLGYFTAFIWGAYKLYKKATTFGTFTAFIQLVAQVQGPFEAIVRTIPQIIACSVSAERIMIFEDMKKERERAVSIPDITEDTGIRIKIEHLYFSYIKGKEIVRDISLSVEPGEIVALIGVSGEGKTTLMRIFLSLLHPDEGNIYLCSRGCMKEISPESRNYFTYVPQGNTLFSGTIAENLRVGKQNATDSEIEEALRAACAWDFIQKLDEGMATYIGESGLGLSEGQAQRICIARALLRSSPVLLLDEATSALDMYTEKNVFMNIKNMKPAKTCISITHRLSVLSSCDKVFRLENGRIHLHASEEFAALQQ